MTVVIIGFMINKISRFLIAISILLVVLLFGWFFVLKGTADKTYINTNRASVIKEIRTLQRLETASYTIEKVIDGGTKETNAFSQFLFGDKILLIAHGQVIAGFDFSQLSEKDIEVKGKDIRIKLPAPQILITSIDNSQTRVYDRQKGILNPGQKDLESEVRVAAEKSIKEAACKGGILQQATDNGRKQLSALLYGLGFTTVTLEIPTGNCP